MSQRQDQYPEGRFGGVTSRLGSAWRGEGREPGTRRAKLMGVISGIKDVYEQKYADFGSSFRAMDDFEGGSRDGYPDAHTTRSEDEEMVLFPSYSRKHIKRERYNDDPNTAENEGNSAAQTGAQAIQQHWDKYEDQDAVVDVDVRGWIYTPHRGAMTRKQRLALGIARQLAGLPAPAVTSSPSKSPSDSRATSPHPLKQRIDEHNERREQRQIEEETQNMIQQAEEEAKKAERGEYSEGSGLSASIHRLHRLRSEDSVDTITMAQKRASWNIPSEMSQEEVTLANTNLMSRLRAFYANPLANSPVSAFFYNDTDSRQRTIYTNAYGQFALRAALDFVPTHVRVLASENLSATQEIKIVEATGVSVISDIDDTIKHTGMLTGAREAFRNAFLRNLDDLVIDGVHEWYARMADAGVQFHYVSNSPWQLFPALARFFAGVDLPPGSFHLKQYSGMLQGIFEPVAERKKSTLDRIARDFPERHFILVGDSGEADLEVYMDFVRDNPGRVLGIYIRDVTTPESYGMGFFDQNIKQSNQSQSALPPSHGKEQSSNENDDPDLKAAIEASLKEFEADELRRKGHKSPIATTKPSISQLDSEDLISFSDSDQETGKKEAPKPPPKRQESASKSDTSLPVKTPPPRPTKPDNMRSPSMQSGVNISETKKQPPNPPVKRPSMLDIPDDYPSQTKKKASPALPPRRTNTMPSSSSSSSSDGNNTNQGFTGAAKATLSSAYNKLPSAPWSSSTESPDSQSNPPSSSTNLPPAPPTLPRRTVTSYPISGAQYVSNRVSSAISSYYNSGNGNSGDTSSGASTPQAQQPNNGLTRAQNNRIELWKRRWSGAEVYLKKQGVQLRTWRIGTDVIEDSLKLVEKAKRAGM